MSIEKSVMMPYAIFEIFRNPTTFVIKCQESHMLDFSLLRPGSKADIVVEIDYKKEKIDVRRSLIYDIIDENIILSQTTPPVTSHYIDRKVMVTYLIRVDNEQVRYGFEGTVSGIIRDYRLTSSESVSAFIVTKQNNPVQFNVRMHFRVKPGIDSGLSLSIAGEKMTIVDISIGGAKVTHRSISNIEARSHVEAVLTIDGEEFPVDALILRLWQTVASKRTPAIEFIVMKFLTLDSGIESTLAKKIREIERQNRLKELGSDARNINGRKTPNPHELSS